MIAPVSPLVTVVIPCRNSGRWLDDAIDSVRAQDFADWEIRLVDDGSDDESVAIAGKHAGADGRIQVEPLDRPTGGANARNRAIRAARGRYIAFLDADDWWRPEKLSTQLGFMEATGAAFSYTAYEKCDADGRLTDRVFRPPERVGYRGLLRTCVIGCSTVILDRTTLGRRYMPALTSAHDFALWLDILREGREARGHPAALTVYREHRGSLSANKLAKAVMHWRIYRGLEGLDRRTSLGLMGSYAWNAARKRLI